MLPGQAAAAQAAYRDALQTASDADDPDAMFRLANLLSRPRWTGSDWVEPPTARDSAVAIYRRLEALEAPPLTLAALARNLDLMDEHRAHVRAGADAGDPVACLQRAYSESNRTFSARGLASSIDAYERCRALAEVAPRPDVTFDQSERSLKRAGSAGARRQRATPASSWTACAPTASSSATPGWQRSWRG